MAQTAEGQREFAALSKKYEPKQNALKSLNGEIETLTKQLQAQSNNLSDAERANRSRIIDDKKKELDREAKEAQDDFQKDMQDVYNGLASKVFDVMQSLAKQQGFTMILDVKGDQPAVLYASTGTDITKQVIEAYNLKSGDSAAAASPASYAVPSRVAEITFQTAVAQTNEFQRAFADLSKKYQPQRDAIKSLNDEIETLTKQLEAQTASLSDAQRAAKARIIDDKKRQLERDTKDAQDAYQQEMQTLYGLVAAKVYDVMQSYAGQKGFTLVLDGSEQQQQVFVLFAASAIDITKPIIETYNLKSGVPPQSGQAVSQTTAAPPALPPGPAKVAVVVFQTAVAQTAEGQRAFADLTKKYEPKKGLLKTLSDEVDALAAQSQDTRLSDAERAVKARDHDEKKKELDRESQAAQDDFQQEMQTLYSSLASKVFDVMQSVAGQQGYVMILDSSQKDSPLLFADDRTDLTQQVIAAYNAKSGITAPVTEAKTQQPAAAIQPAANRESAQIDSARTDTATPPRGFGAKTVNASASALPIPHNYALIFATDDYAHWPHLTNPILDADAVNKTLASLYGFEVEEIRNPTSEQILLKLNDYLHRKFAVQDQLLIFFSGHGYFDDDLGQGFIVPADAQSVSADPIHRNLLAYDEIMRYVNRIPATHIVLIADACFAGTLDRKIADSGLRGDTTDFYAHASLPELLARKEPKRTRRYFASGGKDFVPDGLPGHHSPFISAFLITLNQGADRKGYLTLGDIQQGLNTVNPEPRWGDIQDENEPGADFILLTPAAIAQLSLSN